VSIHLRDEGPGNDLHPIVLIHGTASSLHTWEEWVAALKGQHRVVSFDFPGAGLSGQFPDDDYQIERFTHFVEDFLDQLRIKHATLVGNSFGGRIAWGNSGRRARSRRPSGVDRLHRLPRQGRITSYRLSIGEDSGLPLAHRAHHAAKLHQEEPHGSVWGSAQGDFGSGGSLLRIVPTRRKSPGVYSPVRA